MSAAPDSFAWADDPRTLIGECAWCGDPVPVRCEGSTPMCARCLDVHYPERGRGGARVTAGIVLAFVGAGLSVLPWSCQALRATGIAE
jgi:hypothetical protein